MAAASFVLAVSVLVCGTASQPYPPQPGHQSYGGRPESGEYGGSSGGGGGGQGYSSGSGGSSDGAYQTETKYYYGGKYQGSCSTDGLYYYDDTMFVICSNGYPHEQPCPPGTKTSGSPKYQSGYYYGYTDLCSVNLVDYGYGPEYYAPKGYPVAGGDGYADKKDGSYGAGDVKRGSGYGYGPKNADYHGGSYDASGSVKKDGYPKDNRLPISSDHPQRNSAYPQPDIYKYKDTYSPPNTPYGSTSDKKYR